MAVKILRHMFENPIRAFALICVAGTTIFFGYLAIWLINVLSSPGWCAKAIQAERITPGNSFTGLTACIDLLKMQVGVLAKALLIVLGIPGLGLLVLIVIVIAGGRLAAKVFGQEVDIARGDMPTPVTVTNPPSAPVPTTSTVNPQVPTGPAMPPPPGVTP
jgi:hypothetical protein